MITKMTIKNQVTIPKKILLRAGLAGLKEGERYFDVKIKGAGIFLKPVTLIIEDRIPAKKMEKFESWAAKIEKGDKAFESPDAASDFLKKRIKKR